MYLFLKIKLFYFNTGNLPFTPCNTKILSNKLAIVNGPTPPGTGEYA
jgi:hypothetical protein